MSWSTPPTWVTGDWVTAGVLNASLKENAEYLYGTGVNGLVTFGLRGLTYVSYETAMNYGTVSWDPAGFIAHYIGGTPLPLQGVVPVPDGYNLITASMGVPAVASAESRMLRVEATDQVVIGPLLVTSNRQSRGDTSMIVSGIIRSEASTADEWLTNLSGKVTVSGAFGGEWANVNHDFQCHQIRGL